MLAKRLLMSLSFFMFLIGMHSAYAQSLRELRDEGICNTGWIAGNAYGTAIWPQLRPYVGRDGEFYNGFIRIRAPEEDDLDDQLVASMNISLYNECRENGANAPLNGDEIQSRAIRNNQIVDALNAQLP